jgi:glucan phosphoethanolaminetransferase (alkaline phosphatase superfamily)
MELTLNLGWAAMAIAICWLWVRHARRESQGLWAQFVSVALVLSTMFVVITIYDDMAMAQNPSETRCFQREEDLGAHALVPHHPAVTSLPTLATELPIKTLRFTMSDSLLIPAVRGSALSSIQNRPPPAA